MSFGSLLQAMQSTSSKLEFLNGDSVKDEKFHHEDTIHHIEFNWFGDRMATCSSDHKVKIWELSEDGTWDVVNEIAPAHFSPVWRLSWAHPDYGVILATCSMDHYAKIWRRKDTDKTEWVKVELTDSSTPITDIKFAPRTWSEDMQSTPELLKLAACSDDNVWLYTIVLGYNETVCSPAYDTIEVADQGKITCLSWCATSRHLILAVGVIGGKNIQSHVDLYILSEQHLREFIPTKFKTIALCSNKLSHLAFRPNNGARDNYIAVATETELLVYKINYEDVIDDVVVQKVEHSGQDSIKHVTWDIFGQEILTLSDNGVKTWSWRSIKNQWESDELVGSRSLQYFLPSHSFTTQ